ncbi:MAG: UTP--glucose-1-phosphate uridylyltransferase [Planctomycetota bacterium]
MTVGSGPETSRLVRAIRSTDRSERDRSFEDLIDGLSVDELLQEVEALERFRAECEEPYAVVRAAMFLNAMYRFTLPRLGACDGPGTVDADSWRLVLSRRFEEAVQYFRRVAAESADEAGRPTAALASGLAAAYRGLAFQRLSELVRKSVRSVRGNAWMFRTGHPFDHPLRIHKALLETDERGAFPVLRESTPVRLDLTHSAWSDIFFLGMDYPEGARVLNASVGLCPLGDESGPKPPIDVYLRVIEEPVLRLTSVDLQTTADLERCTDLFDFGRDHLGLLKAGLCAAGFVPPGLEGADLPMRAVLERVVGPGLGLELITEVHELPKGSRLAVSTSLLASILSVTMRATRQVVGLEGALVEAERRIVAARAILGEWLGGSGGGWQDSGGIWPGLKLIEGEPAEEGDVEFETSRGRLLPKHAPLQGVDDRVALRRMIEEGLVLVHGGMAQDVGPVLEVVTEKYLLRSGDAWTARQESLRITDEILEALRSLDLRALAAATTRTFDGPIRAIVPQATNSYTERLRECVDEEFGEHSLGFVMLGGMSGGGMGFFLDPAAGEDRRLRVQAVLDRVHREVQDGVSFAMAPRVFDFNIDEVGTRARLLRGDEARLPNRYYALHVPRWLQRERQELSRSQRNELERLGEWSRLDSSEDELVPSLLSRLLPEAEPEQRFEGRTLDELLQDSGFDRRAHERQRLDLIEGRIGLSRNRLPTSMVVRDAEPSDVLETRGSMPSVWRSRGRTALSQGEAAVVTLAGGAASRWGGGVQVVKALDPFCRFRGRHRSLLEVHLAKTRQIGSELGVEIPHVVTTSLFTDAGVRRSIERAPELYEGVDLRLSPTRGIGLRLVPTLRDLRFHFHETERQTLDERAERMRDSVEQATLDWASEVGEATDYTGNLPELCLNPPGHFFEVPNMMRNGVLADLCASYPNLRTLCVHHVDSVGVNLQPERLGLHLERGVAASFEVVPRRVHDAGGALARIDGRARLVEGLAMPRDDTEWGLSYYNTGTTWVDIDRLLALFGLDRGDLRDRERVDEAIDGVAQRIPTYVTIKTVKRRFGLGQDDAHPVAQFEKLWGDLTSLPEFETDYHLVPRERGEQLKSPAQLDGWLREGNQGFIESLCRFSDEG